MSVESKEVTLNLLLFAITFPIFLEIEFDFIFYVPCRSEEISPRAEVADRPPPHPLTVSLTVKCSFFYESPKCINAFEENDDYPLIEDQLQYSNAHHFPNSQLLQTPYFAFRCNIWSLKI